MKKYYNTRREAIAARKQRDPERRFLQVFKMPKGTRNAGKFAVCSFTEYLNTY